MYKKLIIVDDEILEANCLKEVISWNDYGLNVEKCFDSAEEALKYIDRNNIDVIISDIRMPGINGIEFCKTVRKKYPEIIFIFISAHKEFEYAKSAIEYRVFDYITKPIDIVQIERTCDKLIAHFELMSKDYPSISLEILHYQQILINYFLNDITEKELAEILKNKKLKNSFIGKKLAYISVIFNDFVDFLDNNPSLTIDKAYAFSLNAADTSGTLIVPLIYSTNGYKALVLSTSDINFEKTLADICKKTTEICRKKFDLDVSIGIIKKYDGLNSFKEKSHISSIVSLPGIKNDSVVIASAKQYIEENYMQDISLFDIANHVSVTPYHFCRVFKKETDVNFTGYLNDVRITHAKQLLLETDLNNEEICEQIGINSTTYFYQLFKAATGVTPHSFRKKK